METADEQRAAAAVLEDAAGVIERDGWTQNALRNEYGWCALGALYGATDAPITESLPRPGIDAFSALSRAAGAQGYDLISDWNNAPGRTKQQVLDALHGAAKDCLREADALDGGAA